MTASVQETRPRAIDARKKQLGSLSSEGIDVCVLPHRYLGHPLGFARQFNHRPEIWMPVFAHTADTLAGSAFILLAMAKKWLPLTPSKSGCSRIFAAVSGPLGFSKRFVILKLRVRDQERHLPFVHLVSIHFVLFRLVFSTEVALA